MNHPKVSVGMPTLNRSHYLRQAIESVLGQTYNDLELWVVDAASSDDTPGVVASFHDHRIHYHRLEKDPGSVETQNLCIDLAQGEHVAILHDDDMWTPEFLERCLERLERNPHAGMVFTDVYLMDAGGKINGLERFDKNDCTLKVPTLFQRLLTEIPSIRAPSVLVRKTCYLDIGQYETAIRCIIDWDMWLRISMKCEVEHISEPLALYRVHPGSDSLNRKLPETRKEEKYVIAKMARSLASAGSEILGEPGNAQAICEAYCQLGMARKYYVLGEGREVRSSIREAIAARNKIVLGEAPAISFMFLTSLFGKRLMIVCTSIKHSLERAAFALSRR